MERLTSEADMRCNDMINRSFIDIPSIVILYRTICSCLSVLLGVMSICVEVRVKSKCSHLIID